jgi:hypothetical protein
LSFIERARHGGTRAKNAHVSASPRPERRRPRSRRARGSKDAKSFVSVGGVFREASIEGSIATPKKRDVDGSEEGSSRSAFAGAFGFFSRLFAR